MGRDEMIAQIAIVIDRAYEDGWNAGYQEAIRFHWKDSLDA